VLTFLEKNKIIQYRDIAQRAGPHRHRDIEKTAVPHIYRDIVTHNYSDIFMT
jgi:hypothetical protein